MPEADPIPLFIRPIRKLNIPYMITGSLACIAYGVPRLTHDADLVTELHHEQLQTMIANRHLEAPWTKARKLEGPS